jgi:hypothetical protein
MVSVIFCQLLAFSIWDCPKIYIGAYVQHGPIICKQNFQLVFKQKYSSQLKTNYIFVKLAKNTTILVQNVPSKCSPLGLWTAARLCSYIFYFIL